MAQIRDGQFLYLDNLKDDSGNCMAKYLVANDTLKRYWLLDERPDQWVKYGQYEMRSMDKLLIEAGFIARAVVRWGGEYSSQRARPYLWKSSRDSGQYQQSWTDPRLPQREQKRQQAKSLKPKTPKKNQGMEI